MIYALVFISFYSNLRWTRENMNHSARSWNKACFEVFLRNKSTAAPPPMFVFLKTKFVFVSDQCSFGQSKIRFLLAQISLLLLPKLVLIIFNFRFFILLDFSFHYIQMSINFFMKMDEALLWMNKEMRRWTWKRKSILTILAP